MGEASAQIPRTKALGLNRLKQCVGLLPRFVSGAGYPMFVFDVRDGLRAVPFFPLPRAPKLISQKAGGRPSLNERIPAGLETLRRKRFVLQT